MMGSISHAHDEREVWCFTLIIQVVIVCAALVGAEALSADDVFTYKSNSGVIFEVTESGLSSVKVDEREIASGGWRFLYVHERFGGNPEGLSDELLESSIQVESDTEVIVRHKHRDVSVRYIYQFDGEDIGIRARVANESPEERFTVAGFGGLSFHFAGPPQGLMPDKGQGGWHPSARGRHRRIGASYAVGKHFGVSAFPANLEVYRSETNFGGGEAETDRELSHFVVAEPARVGIPPESARTFRMGLRVSPDTDWTHLLTPYRDYLHETLGELQYEAGDYRPLVGSWAGASAGHASEDNPYGFFGHRRLDTEEGAEQYADMVIGAAERINAQGVIEWEPAGYTGGKIERGARYRPDHDVWPPEVKKHWTIVQEAAEKAGVRLGSMSRPAALAVRKNWERDRILRFHDESHPAIIRHMVQRFKRMEERGFDITYMDVFGLRYGELGLARTYREELGPRWIGFSEYTSDALLPYWGAYVQMRDFDFEEREPNYWWTRHETLKRFLWLYPKAQLMIRPGDEIWRELDREVRREKFLDLIDFVYDNNMMVLLPERFVRDEDYAARVRETIGKYITEDGEWKNER